MMKEVSKLESELEKLMERILKSQRGETKEDDRMVAAKEAA